MKDTNTMQGMTALAARVEQPQTRAHVNSIKHVCTYAVLAMLGAYAVQLINSAGDIGIMEKNLVIVACTLTLLVVIPMIALTIHLRSRYRAPGKSAMYGLQHPDAIKKEVMAWAFPVVIVAVLAVLGWGMTRSLEVYKPIASKAAPEHVASLARA